MEIRCKCFGKRFKGFCSIDGSRDIVSVIVDNERNILEVTDALKVDKSKLRPCNVTGPFICEKCNRAKRDPIDELGIGFV